MLDDALVPYRLRTVLVGVRSTYLVIAALIPFPLLPGRDDLRLEVFYGLLAVALVGALVVHRLPWEWFFSRGWGMAALYTWSVLDIVLISLIVALCGPGANEAFWIYSLTTIFFAASYPRRGQVALLAFTAVSYLGAEAVAGWHAAPATVVLRLGILVSVAFMASFLSRELADQMAGHRSARQESEQRADLLSQVTQAGRAINSLDPEFALQAVVDATIRLGFDAASVNLVDEDRGVYRPVCVRGLPAAYAESEHELGGGITAQVRQRQQTVVVADYEALEGIPPMLRGYGVQHVMGTPIWIDNQLAGVLIAGTRHRPKELSPQEIEAFELLAAEGGAALTNARRFTAERQTTERLAELDKLKTDFLTSVSHELRTPLTLVSGGAQTLADRWDELDEAVRGELLEAIHENAQRLQSLLLTVLDLAELQAEPRKTELTPVDLGPLLRDVLARYRDGAPGREFALEIGQGLVVAADARLLERVVANLVGNAVVHTPDSATVRVEAHAQDDEAVVSVTDTGGGFPEEDLPRLGDRFFRSKDAGVSAAAGLGVGLALARQVLAIHGGELQLENVPGGGARASFRLPLATRPTAGTPG